MYVFMIYICYLINISVALIIDGPAWAQHREQASPTYSSPESLVQVGVVMRSLV